MSTAAASSITIASANQYAGTVANKLKSMFSTTHVSTSLLTTTLAAEAAKSADCYVNKEGKADAQTGTSATGICQMFPDAFLQTYKFLNPNVKVTDEVIKSYRTKVLADPNTAILYMGTYCALIERVIMGYSEMAAVHEDSYVRSILAAAYHMGPGGVRPLITAAESGGGFDITTFVNLYENWCRTQAGGGVSSRVREMAGVGGSTSDSVGKDSLGTAWKRTDLGPEAKDAADYIAMGNVVGSAAIPEAPTVIMEGLDLPEPRTGLIGNPKLRGTSSPACFELRLNQQDGDSLPGAGGTPLQVKLNVSLQSLRSSSQHIVSRTPTATALLLTFWGMQPDVLVGHGTTGLFLNQTGLTALMSSTVAPGNFADLLEAFDGSPVKVRTALRANKERDFRVAAQDAFAELMALFKNNGLIRFLPQDMLPAADIKNQQYWSPALGATGFQMIARSGEVHTRGYVAFKYKGATHLGYFKSLVFTASADKPYQWNFDFQFKVLQSYTPIFVKG